MIVCLSVDSVEFLLCVVLINFLLMYDFSVCSMFYVCWYDSFFVCVVCVMLFVLVMSFSSGVILDRLVEWFFVLCMVRYVLYLI